MQRRTSTHEAGIAHSTDVAEQIQVARIQYGCVTSRAKQIWMQRRNDGLVQNSKQDPKLFCKVYQTRKRDTCPVSPLEQKEAFQALWCSACWAPIETWTIRCIYT